MPLSNAVGTSRTFKNIVDTVDLVAPLNCTVLLRGETGTGKEMVAQAIHDTSGRTTHPFIALNCAALPLGLLESELFGHERGAFTGAVSQTIGRFETAQRGTLFLDEIGDLPLELQPKLLRALQEQRFERVGGCRSLQVDVRVIGATNQDLWRMVQQGKFRADLYYRLEVFPITLPPLRERAGDIPLLVDHFVRQFAHRYSKVIEYIPEGLLDALTKYHWPGNIRELQNVIERSVIMSRGPMLLLSSADGLRMLASKVPPAGHKLADAERNYILDALVKVGWVVGGKNGAAARLGLPRTTLLSRMIKLGISRSLTAAESVGDLPILTSSPLR